MCFYEQIKCNFEAVRIEVSGFEELDADRHNSENIFCTRNVVMLQLTDSLRDRKSVV